MVVELSTRREFLVGAVGLAASTSPFARRVSLAQGSSSLPPPGRSGIDHVVVLMMENRSFDHLLGWLPGADGKQAGLTFPDAHGLSHATFPLAPDFEGCAYADPDHSYAGGRTQFDNGACDGFLRTSKDLFPIGYYRQLDLPFLGRAAPEWTVCDRYFAAILGPTFPNRFYLHAGVTDRLADTIAPSRLPTIWDRLAARGIPAAYYYGNVPFLFLWGLRYSSILRSHARFFADCRSGRLPAVAYVDPVFTFLGNGIPADDHPHADVRAGEDFLNRIYRAVTTSPAWPRTLLAIVFDEWGGFFDHVPPPAGRDVRPAYAQRGFRVPCLLVSPYAPRGRVSHRLFDHASILKLIEWRFGLLPLSARDAGANNLAEALDFSRRNLAAPLYDVPRFAGPAACPA